MDRLRFPKRAASIAAISVAVLVAFAGSARAQDADAEALFENAAKLEAQGKLAEACAEYEASNKIEPRAGTLIRLGDCREHNHQIASAWSAYKDALARAKDPLKKKIAAAKVPELEGRMSRLTVAVAEAARVPGLAITRDGAPVLPAEWNVALPIDGGHHVIAARAPGYRDWQLAVDIANESANARADVPPPQAVAATTATPPTTTTVTATAPPARPSQEATGSRWTHRRVAAVAVGGLAIAAVAVGLGYGHAADGANDDAHRLCADPAMPCANAAAATADNAHARDLARDANIGFGVAAAAAIAAGVLWFTGAPEHGTVVAPVASSDSVQLVLAGRF